MHKLFSRAAGAALLAGLAFGSTAASAAQTTGTANARIMTAVSVIENNTLEFGTILADSDGGTVTVANNGTRTCTGLTCGTASDVYRAGAFTVTGSKGATVSVTFSATSLELKNGSGGTMNAVLSNSLSGSSLTLDNNGSGTFNVGGVLTVNGGQADGNYTGSYTVTVNY